MDSTNEKFVIDYLNESYSIAEYQLSLKDKIIQISSEISKKIDAGGKILLCGNGGSASDSQHIAAEFVNRFKINRSPLPAISLTTDTSNITSIANDFGFQYIFSKQIQAIANEQDVLIAISTSGKSENVIEALKVAKEKNILTLSMTGKNINNVEQYSDLNVSIPSDETGVVQQAHITILQIIAGLIEQWHAKKIKNHIIYKL